MHAPLHKTKRQTWGLLSTLGGVSAARDCELQANAAPVIDMHEALCMHMQDTGRGQSYVCVYVCHCCSHNTIHTSCMLQQAGQQKHYVDDIPVRE